MDLFVVIANLVIFLTAGVVVLSIAAIFNHMRAERREDAIRRRRERARATLLDCLGRGGDAAQHAAAELHAEDPGLVEGVLLPMIDEADAGTRTALQAVCRALGLVDRELAALRDRAWGPRLQAATRLGFMGATEAVEPLTAALQDEMLDVRLGAAQALARLRAAEAVDPIVRYLSLPAHWPLQRVAEIVGSMGDAAIPPLEALLGETDLPVAARAAAVRALGLLRAHGAASLIMEQLGHANAEVRIQSAKALGDLGARDAIAPLRLAMDDAVWEVRAAAAASLGRLQDEAAVPRLAEGLGDVAWWVRFNAAQGLWRLGAAGREALRAALGAEDDFAREISRQVLEEHGLLSPQPGAAS